MTPWSCSPSFISSFIHQNASLWKQELALLSEISVTQPNAAYAAFVHGVVSKWNYVFTNVCMYVISGSL